MQWDSMMSLTVECLRNWRRTTDWQVKCMLLVAYCTLHLISWIIDAIWNGMKRDWRWMMMMLESIYCSNEKKEKKFYSLVLTKGKLCQSFILSVTIYPISKSILSITKHNHRIIYLFWLLIFFILSFLWLYIVSNRIVS